eukprot:g620.t1
MSSTSSTAVEIGDSVHVDVYDSGGDDVVAVVCGKGSERGKWMLKFPDKTVIEYREDQFSTKERVAEKDMLRVVLRKKIVDILKGSGDLSKNAERRQEVCDRILQVVYEGRYQRQHHHKLQIGDTRIDVDLLARESRRVFVGSEKKSQEKKNKTEAAENKHSEDNLHVHGEVVNHSSLSLGLQRKLYMAQMTAQQRALSVLIQRREYIEKQLQVIPVVIRRTKRAGQALFGVAATWLKTWDKEKLQPLRDVQRQLRKQCADLDAHLATVRDELETARENVHNIVAPELIRGLNRYDRLYEEIKKSSQRHLRRLGAIAKKASRDSCPRQPLAYLDHHPRLQSNRVDDSDEDHVCYRQSMHCFLTQYFRAAGTMKTLETHLKVWAKRHNGKVLIGTLKRPERVLQKSYENYLGDFSKVRDIARGSIKFDNVESICDCLDDMCNRTESVDVLRIKCRLSPSFDASASGGYRDVLVNVSFRDLPPPFDTYIVEIQLHLDAFLRLKHADFGGHKTYRVARELHIFDPNVTHPTISAVNDRQLKGLAQGTVQVLNLCHLRIRDKEILALIRALKRAGETSLLRSLIIEHINTGERGTAHRRLSRKSTSGGASANITASVAASGRVVRRVAKGSDRRRQLNNKKSSLLLRGMLGRKSSSKHLYFDDYFKSIGRPVTCGEVPSIGDARSPAAESGDARSPTCFSLKSFRTTYLRCEENKSLIVPERAYILAAYYGSADNYMRGKDVTAKVIELVRKGGSKEIDAIRALFGDPWYGVRKTLIVKVAVPIKVKRGTPLDCQGCAETCIAGVSTVVPAETRCKPHDSLPCAQCGKYFCLRCVAMSTSWQCTMCRAMKTKKGKAVAKLLRHRTTSDSYVTRERMRTDAIDDEGDDDNIERGVSFSSLPAPPLEGFLKKKGKGDKRETTCGFRRRWLMLRDGRLSWSLGPGAPERSFVDVTMYVLISKGLSVTGFALNILQDYAHTDLRPSLELRSETIGDKNRWISGLIAHGAHVDGHESVTGDGGRSAFRKKISTGVMKASHLIGRRMGRPPTSSYSVVDAQDDVGGTPDSEMLWELARALFAHPPYSNGNDKRYTYVKSLIREKFGKASINASNKPRLKMIAISRGVETRPKSVATKLDEARNQKRLSVKKKHSVTVENIALQIVKSGLGFFNEDLKRDVNLTLSRSKCNTSRRLLKAVLDVCGRKEECASPSTLVGSSGTPLRVETSGNGEYLHNMAGSATTSSSSPLIPTALSSGFDSTLLSDLPQDPSSASAPSRNMVGLHVAQWAGIAHGLEHGGRALRHISVKSSNIDDRGVASMLSYSWSNMLQKIDMSHCLAVTDMSLAIIGARCGPSLQEVLLTNCLNVTDDGILALCDMCPRLRRVNLDGIRGLTDKSAETLFTRCRDELETLELKRLTKLTDASFEGLAIGSKNGDNDGDDDDVAVKLCYLDVRQCHRLTDRALIIVAEKCERLETCLIESSDKISDVGVVAIAKTCTSLKVLQLQNTPKVTDIGISAIGQRCLLLTSLNVIGCSLSDASLLELSKYCKHIHDMRLQGGTITETGILALVRENIDLVEMHIGKVPISDDGLATLGVLTDLEIFELYKCDEITEVGVASFVTQSRQLKKINVWGNKKMIDDIKTVDAALDLKRRVAEERAKGDSDRAASDDGLEASKARRRHGKKGSWLFRAFTGRSAKEAPGFSL